MNFVSIFKKVIQVAHKMEQITQNETMKFHQIGNGTSSDVVITNINDNFEEKCHASGPNRTQSGTNVHKNGYYVTLIQ